MITRTRIKQIPIKFTSKKETLPFFELVLDGDVIVSYGPEVLKKAQTAIEKLIKGNYGEQVSLPSCDVTITKKTNKFRVEVDFDTTVLSEEEVKKLFKLEEK